MLQVITKNQNLIIPYQDNKVEPGKKTTVLGKRKAVVEQKVGKQNKENKIPRIEQQLTVKTVFNSLKSEKQQKKIVIQPNPTILLRQDPDNTSEKLKERFDLTPFSHLFTQEQLNFISKRSYAFWMELFFTSMTYMIKDQFINEKKQDGIKLHLFYYIRPMRVCAYIKLDAVVGSSQAKRVNKAYLITFSTKRPTTIEEVARIRNIPYASRDAKINCKAALQVTNNDLTRIRKIEREAKILSMLKDNPNICQLISYQRYVGKNEKNKIVLYEQLYFGDLHGLLSSSFNPLPMEERYVVYMRLFENLLSAVSSVHEAEIVHRDIKLENIFIKKYEGSNRYRAVLGDFESSTFGNVSRAKSRGTNFFKAPECLDETLLFDKGVDIWSLGCALYLLLSNLYPPYWMLFSSIVNRLVFAVFHKADNPDDLTKTMPSEIPELIDALHTLDFSSQIPLILEKGKELCRLLEATSVGYFEEGIREGLKTLTRDFAQILFKLFQTEEQLRNQFPLYPKPLVDLLVKMLTVDSRDRPPADELLEFHMHNMSTNQPPIETIDELLLAQTTTKR